MSDSSHPNDEVQQLFRKHVPEVAAGIVELVAVARESGRLMVAVRSRDSSVHPVTACVGVRGVRPKSISRELGGEKVSIVLWSESPENFVLHSLSPYGPAAVRMPKVALDTATHQAKVEVDRETLAYFTGEHAVHLRLASQLVGWDIQLVCHDQN